MHYTVLEIVSGVVLYTGRNLHAAARYLTPGTCYGRGESYCVAFGMAKRWAVQFNKH